MAAVEAASSIGSGACQAAFLVRGPMPVSDIYRTSPSHDALSCHSLVVLEL